MKYCDSCHSAYPDDFTSCPRDGSSLRGTSDLPAGLVLRGKYQILEKIGSGGMAAVYRARHLAFGEIRAIKVVSGRLAEDTAFLRRFRAEAVVTRKLQHPNAVRVDDLDATEDGRPFIVMEFFEGQNLRELVKTGGALAPSRALRIASQVASALGAAHGIGITHRDIKPDNILVGTGPDGQETAKVLDFGIAKVREGFFDGGEGYSPTQTGTVLGTPQYISPEQALGKRAEEVDGRADLYSLGVVLYEMVTGRLPFQSDTAMGMLLHHLQTAPTPPDLVRPDLALPAMVSDVLMRALQKDPAHRFQTADEMRVALDELAALPELSSRPAPPPGVDTEAPTRAFGAVAAPTVMPKQAPTQPAPAAAAPIPPSTPAKPRKRRRWLWGCGALLFLFVLLPAVCSKRKDRASAQPSPSVAPSTEATASPDAETLAEQAKLVDKVEEALSNAKATEDEPILVEAREDEIFLRGTVSSPVVKAVAEALAEAVAGVDTVHNELQVEGEAPPAEMVPGMHAPGALPPAPPAPRGPRLPPPRTPLSSRDEQRIEEAVAAGEAALEAGNFNAAISAFSRVMQLDPNNGDAAEGIARATEQLTESVSRRVEETRRRVEEGNRRREEARRRRASPSPP